MVQARLCQLDRLANCLLEGLQQWPYVLDIITKLCKVIQSYPAPNYMLSSR